MEKKWLIRYGYDLNSIKPNGNKTRELANKKNNKELKNSIHLK